MFFDNWNYSISVLIYSFMLLTFVASVALYAVYKLGERRKRKAAAAKAAVAAAATSVPSPGHGPAPARRGGAKSVTASQKPRFRFG